MIIINHMENYALVCETIRFIKEMFCDIFDGHDVDHSLRVYNNAMLIIESIPECDALCVSLAALLHDVDDHKLFETKNNYNARYFLSSHHLEENYIDTICSTINAVSFSQNKGISPPTIEGKIVQDADRLDAIGAIGIARTFTFSGAHGRGLEASVQHFYDKLFLLKESMNTEKAKEMATARHIYMKNYLEQLQQETNGLY